MYIFFISAEYSGFYNVTIHTFTYLYLTDELMYNSFLYYGKLFYNVEVSH